MGAGPEPVHEGTGHADSAGAPLPTLKHNLLYRVEEHVLHHDTIPGI